MRTRAVGQEPVAQDRVELLERLLLRVAVGEDDVFARLYTVIADSVAASVRAIVSDPDEVQDISQEVALQVWRHAHRYDPSRSGVLTWVKLIAHHRAVDHIRTNQLRAASESAAAHRERRHGSGLDVDPVEQVQLRFEHDAVRAALTCLTPIQRQAIVLAYYRGHTYQQVAALLEVPESTAKTRIRDGLIRIRHHLHNNHWA